MTPDSRRSLRPTRVGLPLATAAAVLTLVLAPQAQQPAPVPPPPSANVAPDLVRLVEQTTFGPTPELLAHVQQVGADAFLSEQLAAALTPYPDLPPMPSTAPDSCTGTCRRDHYTMYPLQRHFFTNALFGNDQLRQRVAFALGQILVVSGLDVRLSSWMQPYQQLLYAGAFGSFRQLLADVTLNAAMGSYTDTGSSARGRWIPTISVDEYAATLATWYGLGSADIPAVFPNLGRFQTPNLGFV